MYKKILTFIVVFILLTGNVVWARSQSPIYPEDRGVLLYEMNSDQIIIEHNSNQKFYPASTTKIMTAILVIENLPLDMNVIVGKEITTIPFYSSRADLVEGEKLTVEELLYALLLPSANDAANVLAVQVVKKVNSSPLDTRETLSYFSKLMNEKAKKLGASNTNFVNSHGLHNTNHYTTPKDLLQITKELLKSETLKKIINNTQYHVTTNKKDHNWYSTNVFLHKRWDNIPFANRVGENHYYNPKVNGIKTGTTTPAGRCVVFSANNNNLDLIGIILHSTLEELWKEGTDMMNYAFENYEYVHLTQLDQEIESIPISNGKKNQNILSVITKEDISLLLEKTPLENIQTKISYNSNILFEGDEVRITDDIIENTKIGMIGYYINGEFIEEVDVYSGNTILKKTYVDYIFTWYTNILIIILLIFIVRILYVRKKRIRKRRR